MPYGFNPLTKKLDMLNLSPAVMQAVYENYLMAVTTDNMDFYLDPTGSDTTGDGTLSRPYRQPEKALSGVPRKIRHRVRIMATTGSYDWPETCTIECEAGGSFSVIGVGADDLVSGPHTVGVVSNLGLGGKHCTVPGATWTADQKLGTWVRVLDGPNAFDLQPVVRSEAAAFDIRYVTSPPTNCCAVEFVRPSVIFNVSKTAQFNLANLACSWNAIYAPCVRFLFTNIIFDASTSTETSTFVFAGNAADGGVFFDFVQFIGPNTYGSVVEFLDMSWNGGYVVDFGAYALTGVVATNFGLYPEKPAMVITQSTGRGGIDLFAMGRCSYAYEMICSGTIMLADFESGGGSHHFACETMFCWNARMYTVYAYLLGKTGSPTIGLYEGCVFHFYKAYAVKGANIINVGNLCDLFLETVTCHPTTVTGVAVLIGAGCQIAQETALANFVGAGGAYTFQAPAVDITGATWMAALGDSATDSKGSFITRHPS